MSLIPVSAEDGSVTLLESNDAVVVHCVDAAGVYVGLTQPSATNLWVSGPPPDNRVGWRWVFDDNAWRRTPPLPEVKLVALREIDAAAGEARLRYITDAPGQSAVYARKLDQAKQFAALLFVGQAPPYIAAEATATGQTTQDVAQAVIDAATAWDDAKSPAIEAARIKGKRAVAAAATALAVRAARLAAATELEAL